MLGAFASSWTLIFVDIPCTEFATHVLHVLYTPTSWIDIDRLWSISQLFVARKYTSFYGACLCFWTRDTSLTSPGPLRPAAPEWSWMCCLANDQRDKFSSLNLEAYRRKIKSLPCLSTDFVAWCCMHLYLPFIYSMIPQADGLSRASN